MKTIRHTGIVVNDLEKSLHFYGKLLDLRIKTNTQESGSFIATILGIPGASIRTVKMSTATGSTVLELIKFDFSSAKNDRKLEIYSCGPTHVAFEVENIDLVYEKLIKEKVVFLSMPQINLEATAKVVFCRDPDGTFIELVEILQRPLREQSHV